MDLVLAFQVTLVLALILPFVEVQAKPELLQTNLGLNTSAKEALPQTAHFVQTTESQQGDKMACSEEISFSQGWLGAQRTRAVASSLKKNFYSDYLLSLVHESA